MQVPEGRLKSRRQLAVTFFLFMASWSIQCCHAAPCIALVRPSLGSPLESLVSIPRFECVSSDDEFNSSIFTEVSNTSILERGYAFDAEQSQITLSTSARISETVHFITALPLRSRTAGATDSVIHGWHDTFNLPEGDSNDFDQNSYEVRGKRRDGARFFLPKQNLTIANVISGVEGTVPTVDNLNWILSISLPTASEEAGHDGANTNLDFRRELYLDRWSFVGAAGATIVGDSSSHGVEYNRYLWRVQPTVRYHLLEKVILEAVFQYEKTAVHNLPGYPDAVLWLDSRIQFELGRLGNVMISLREDLTGSNAQADVVMGMSWSIRL